MFYLSLFVICSSTLSKMFFINHNVYKNCFSPPNCINSHRLMPGTRVTTWAQATAHPTRSLKKISNSIIFRNISLSHNFLQKGLQSSTRSLKEISNSIIFQTLFFSLILFFKRGSKASQSLKRKYVTFSSSKLHHIFKVFLSQFSSKRASKFHKIYKGYPSHFLLLNSIHSSQLNTF